MEQALLPCEEAWSFFFADDAKASVTLWGTFGLRYIGKLRPFQKIESGAVNGVTGAPRGVGGSVVKSFGGK